ncbi:MAG: DNA repair protein RecN [Actinomycetales bacterium]|nr:DNA repair protein RecN [Actinomycetales bacterium]
MIEELTLRNIGVIERAELAFSPGLTAITGETGAGKTMILTGLGLLTGRRADPALVRAGQEQGVVEGVLTARDEAELAEWAAASGGTLDDGALLVGRTVPANGRARAHLGGRAVPAATLAELGDRYITIHGQADQQRLRSPAHQRAALDDFADHGELLGRYRAAWDRLQRCRADLADWEATAARLAAERDRLAAGLGDIDAVAPRAGEDDELRTRAERLANIEDLRVALETAWAILSGGDDAPGVLGDLSRSSRALGGVARYGAEIGDWVSAIDQAITLLSEVANELGASRGELDADPRLLDEVHARRAQLAVLMRSHGPTLDDVLSWAERARARLAEIDALPTSRQAVAEEEARARDEAERLAAELRESRRRAAGALAETVNRELRRLAMRGAHLHVRVEPTSLGPSGADDVTITLAPHPGAPPLPVASAASGGELSRIMLALEVALARRPGDHTFIFDEVDAGIGGSAAVEVGRRLRDLSRVHQVVVVTHLAQVAAGADRQLVVSKRVSDSGATTVVTAVSGAERERELARMLAGDESPTALRHAKELLARADVGP